MPNLAYTDDDLEIIKRNHKRYLEENMVMTGGIKHTQLIKTYAENIGFYRESKERYLNSAIQQVSLGQKAGHFALSALLGIGLGAGTFIASKAANLNPLSAINPLEAGRDVVSGAFSGVLGVGTTFLIYEAWRQSKKKPLADDFEVFQAALSRAGFKNEKFATLSSELVKLFHYRECLLLNLNDGYDIYFRDEFTTRFVIQDQHALNMAIEVYFLDQLSHLFHNAFKDIYSIQEEEIKGEMEHTRILRWLKRFFESDESRYQFTQQLQVYFMEECLSYLEKERIKLTFPARHPYFMASVVGLVAGTVALGLACSILGCPLVIGLGGVALITAACTAALTFWTLKHVDFFKYQRDYKNRASIGHIIEYVNNECLRMKRLIKNTVDTSPEEIISLSKYKDHNSLSGFLKLFTCVNPKVIPPLKNGHLAKQLF